MPVGAPLKLVLYCNTMMRGLFSFAAILTVSVCAAQKNKTQLISFSSLPMCDSINVELWRVRPALYLYEHSGDEYRLVFRLAANCENNRYGAMLVEHDTLRLYFMNKGEMPRKKGMIIQNGFKPYTTNIFDKANCDCYFEMKYHIYARSLPTSITLNDEPVFTPVNQVHLTDPEYEVLNNGDTVNYVDSRGHLQGRWISRNEKDQIVVEHFYHDNAVDSTFRYQWLGNEVVAIGRFFTNTNDYSETAFYPDGMVKKDCVTTMRYVKPAFPTVVDADPSKGVIVTTCWTYAEDGTLLTVQSYVQE
jgi:hypothetical protein